MEVPLLRTGAGRRSSSGYGSLSTTPVLGAAPAPPSSSAPPPLALHTDARDRAASTVHFAPDALLEESKRASREILGHGGGAAPPGRRNSIGSDLTRSPVVTSHFGSVDAFCVTLYRYWLYGGRGQAFERTISSGLRFSGLGVILVLLVMVDPAVVTYRCADASGCAVPFSTYIVPSRLAPPYSPFVLILLALAVVSASRGALVTAQAWSRQRGIEEMSLLYRDALGLYDGLLAVTPWQEVVKRVNAAVWMRAQAAAEGNSTSDAAPHSSSSAWMAAVDVLASRYRKVLGSRAQTLDYVLSEFQGRGGGSGNSSSGAAGRSGGSGLGSTGPASGSPPLPSRSGSTILSSLNGGLPGQRSSLELLASSTLGGGRRPSGTSGAPNLPPPAVGVSPGPTGPRSLSAAPVPWNNTTSNNNSTTYNTSNNALTGAGGLDALFSADPKHLGSSGTTSSTASSGATKVPSPALASNAPAPTASGSGTPSYALLRPHMDVIPDLALGAPAASVDVSAASEAPPTASLSASPASSAGGDGAVSSASTTSLTGGSFPVAVISDRDELRLQLAGITLDEAPGEAASAAQGGSQTRGTSTAIPATSGDFDAARSSQVAAPLSASASLPVPQPTHVAPLAPPPLPLARLAASSLEMQPPVKPPALADPISVTSPPPAPSRRASFGPPPPPPASMLPLPALHLAARVMRRDNYMIALVSSKTIDTTLRVPNPLALLAGCCSRGSCLRSRRWRAPSFVPATSASGGASLRPASSGRHFTPLSDSAAGASGASEVSSGTDSDGSWDDADEEEGSGARTSRAASPAGGAAPGAARRHRWHGSGDVSDGLGYSAALPMRGVASPRRSKGCCSASRPTLRCRLPWTRTIEWSLWVTVIKPMLQRQVSMSAPDAGSAPMPPTMATSVLVRQSFVGLEGPQALRRRLRWLGAVWLLSLPLMLPVALLLLLVRHSEQAYGATAAGAGARGGDIWGDTRFSPWSRRAFGEYNELPHVLASRLRSAVAPTTRVLAAAGGVTASRSGPSRLAVGLPILLTQLTFFTAALLVVAVLLSVIDADLLVNLHVVGGQNLTWTIGVLTAAVGGLRAMSRVAEYTAREGEGKGGAGGNPYGGPFWEDVLAVVQALRYLKAGTRRRLEPLLQGGGATAAPQGGAASSSTPLRGAPKQLPPHLWASSVPEGVRRLVSEVKPLLHSRLAEYLLELGSVATTPLLLLFVFPRQADSVVNFVRAHTTVMPEVGPVCAASAMAAAAAASTGSATAAAASSSSLPSARGRAGSSLGGATASSSPLLQPAGSGEGGGRPPVAPPLFAGSAPAAGLGSRAGSFLAGHGSGARGGREEVEPTAAAFHQLPVDGSMVLVTAASGTGGRLGAGHAPSGGWGAASTLRWKKMDQSTLSFAAHHADVAWPRYFEAALAAFHLQG